MLLLYCKGPGSLGEPAFALLYHGASVLSSNREVDGNEAYQ